tara:strand:+ start:716 stop:1174 length:459 start_codon:yes stop_codon:yes gene_type:complete
VPLINYFLLAISTSLFLTFAHAQEVIVVDGDTIKVDGEKIRFTGIDAPELRQTCIKKDEVLPCGELSKILLEDLIQDQKVSCVREGKDRYGRTLAECYVNEQSLSAILVRSGYAFAYRQYSRKFIEEEKYAKINSNGMWDTEFQFPWNFRKK